MICGTMNEVATQLKGVDDLYAHYLVVQIAPNVEVVATNLKDGIRRPSVLNFYGFKVD